MSARPWGLVITWWLLAPCSVWAQPVEAARPAKSLPLPGEVFVVDQAAAFVIPAAASVTQDARPWVWYAPTLPGLPGPEERWMFERFLKAGVSIAGVDVGESYGSPAGRRLFTSFYQSMTERRSFSARPVLLGRSRGGLQALNWAAEHPTQVAGFAGIYPVCNLVSWPGLEVASGAYGMTAIDLRERLADHNPLERLAALAQAHVPIFAIHGDADQAVPLEANSGELARRYQALGGKCQLVVPPGQGHSMWTGFFECQELVDFVIEHAQAHRPQ